MSKFTHERKRKLGVAISELNKLAPIDDPVATGLIRRYDAWYTAIPKAPTMDDPKWGVGWDLCNEVEIHIDRLSDDAPNVGTSVVHNTEDTMTREDRTDAEVQDTQIHNVEERRMDTRKTKAAVAGALTGKALVVGGVVAATTGRAVGKASVATKDFMVQTGIPTARKGLRGLWKAAKDYGTEVRDEVRKARNSN